MASQFGGHIFSGLDISNSSVHLGDVHNHQAKSQISQEDIRRALFLTDPRLDRAALITAKGERVDETCEWILEDRIFQSWLAGGSKALWISGGPGKGKTMLSIFLTQHFQEQQHQHQGHLIYYFCTSEHQSRDSACAVLRGLLSQLLRISPGLASHCNDHFETEERGEASLSSVEALWDMLTAVLKDTTLGKILCIIDGLDECDKESVRFLTAKLRALCITPGFAPFKIVIVSREVPGARLWPQVKLDDDNDNHVKCDIEKFVRSRVAEFRRLPDCNNEFLESLATQLLDRAENTFLWVGFAMHELLESTTLTEVEETLASLPAGLPALYGRMLLNIEPQRRQKVAKILSWVTLAIQPLNLRQFASLLGVQDSDFDRHKQSIMDEIRRCSPLLHVQEERVQDTDDWVQKALEPKSSRFEQTIKLVHRSAADYLLRDIDDDQPAPEPFRVKRVGGHMEILEYCLAILDQDLSLSRTQPPSERWHDAVRERRSMLFYAILYWHKHAALLPQSCADLFRAPFFGKASFARQNALVAFCRLRKIEAGQGHRGLALYLLFCVIPSAYFPLHVACCFGILPWVAALCGSPGTPMLTTAQTALDQQDPRGLTPFLIAVDSGNMEVVSFLISLGTDVNYAEILGSYTALHFAACRGNLPLMEVLLDHGANANAKCSPETRRKRMELIFTGGNLDLHSPEIPVSVPLDFVAVELTDPSFNRCLKAAELLIRHRADIKQCGDAKARDCFRWAALSGVYPWREILDDQQVQWNPAAFEGADPLRTALATLDIPLINLCIDQGRQADPDWPSVLNLSHGGDDRLKAQAMEALLAAKAPVEPSETLLTLFNGMRFTWLHQAVLGCLPRCVSLLLEHGANVSAKFHSADPVPDLEDSPNIFLIAREGAVDFETGDLDPEDMRRLFAEGHLRFGLHNDPTKNLRPGTTALHIAAEYLHVAPKPMQIIVRLLLEAGADVSLKDDAGKTPEDLCAHEVSHFLFITLRVQSLLFQIQDLGAILTSGIVPDVEHTRRVLAGETAGRVRVSYASMRKVVEKVEKAWNTLRARGGNVANQHTCISWEELLPSSTGIGTNRG